ncbi:MAG TPA: FtsX-like permease family protein [Sedimentisphaerales bacterium]|nr:FtsX-like permease family protein [Sedimentisphaerales bacterium]
MAFIGGEGVQVWGFGRLTFGEADGIIRGMVVFSLILKEIWHRKVNFVLSCLAVVTAVTLFIGFFTAGKASERETARLMLSMGYNMHIISKQADPNVFLLTGLADQTIPQEYLEVLNKAEKQAISYNHLLPTLQRKIRWRGLDVILTGVGEEVWPAGQKKPSMSFKIEAGDVYLGYRVWSLLGIKRGQGVDIEGKTFTVRGCLAETGGGDDMRIQCCLADAQEILKLPGRISEIKAVDCLCFADTNDTVGFLRSEIGVLLPEARVFQAKAIAQARADQRKMIRDLFAVIMPFTVIGCGVWIGVLAIMNIRERQQEIGIMRALGYGSGRIAGLFLGKAVLVGLCGSVVGFAVGTYLALYFGPRVFHIPAAINVIQPEPLLLVVSLVFACLFAAASSFIPAMIAVAYDPAVTLREE